MDVGEPDVRPNAVVEPQDGSSSLGKKGEGSSGN